MITFSLIILALALFWKPIYHIGEAIYYKNSSYMGDLKDWFKTLFSLVRPGV